MTSPSSSTRLTFPRMFLPSGSAPPDSNCSARLSEVAQMSYRATDVRSGVKRIVTLRGGKYILRTELSLWRTLKRVLMLEGSWNALMFLYHRTENVLGKIALGSVGVGGYFTGWLTTVWRTSRRAFAPVVVLVDTEADEILAKYDSDSGKYAQCDGLRNAEIMEMLRRYAGDFDMGWVMLVLQALALLLGSYGPGYVANILGIPLPSASGGTQQTADEEQSVYDEGIWSVSDGIWDRVQQPAYATPLSAYIAPPSAGIGRRLSTQPLFAGPRLRVGGNTHRLPSAYA